jgi:hypothetical protein
MVIFVAITLSMQFVFAQEKTVTEFVSENTGMPYQV